jgi:FixJ family two-component response regulator
LPLIISPGRFAFWYASQKWFQLSRVARQERATIVISGVGRIEEIHRAYNMGADSFLTKPIKAADLSQLATGFAAYWSRDRKGAVVVRRCAR